MSVAALLPRRSRDRNPARVRVRPAGRALERQLLAWCIPLAGLGAFAVSRSPGVLHPTLVEALTAFGIVLGACLFVHVVLSVASFDGDPILLPALTVLFLIGTAYHLGLPAAAGGSSFPLYLGTVLVGLVVLTAVICMVPFFQRASLLVEERVWWKIARDRPYYESAPFHLLLFGVMLLLVGWLVIGGRPSGSSGAIILAPIWGSVRFTPSEFVRLAVAFFLADYLSRHSRVLRNLRQPVVRAYPFGRLTIENRAHLIVLLTTVSLYCIFFILFRDFGPAAIIFGLTLVCLWAATLRLTTPAILLAAVLGIIWLAGVLPGANGTLHNRLAMWRDPWNTAFVNGDHQARILWSIAAGGWFGLGSGVANLRVQLPEAARDTAFAGVAAALGFWAALAVLVLFAGITWRGLQIARAAQTDRSRLLALSLTALLAFQAIWICGAMVRVFPFSGINLPFVSTGLSNVVASAIALGCLMNLSRSRPPGDATEATPEVARGVRMAGWPIVAAFLLPAVGLALYAVPPLLGDDTLARPARALGRNREPVIFSDPYLESYRQQFPRGRIFSSEGVMLAGPVPGSSDRKYPLGRAAAQLIGWTTQGRFSAQAGSVESGWDAALRGYEDRQLAGLFRTRHNPFIARPRPQDLGLTVAADLQRSASRRLRETIRRWDGSGGAGVMFDANTGQVLCAVTEPAFDPNGLTLARMQDYVARNPGTQVLVNKALAREARLFPGSTFKILTAAAALADPPSGTSRCDGRNARELSWKYGGITYRRPAGRIGDFSGHGHGTLDLEYGLDTALVGSCNVFFATLASSLGPDRMRAVMESAELSGIPEQGTLSAYLPETGFGQVTIKVSPLEMASVAAAVAVATPGSSDAVAAARPYWVETVNDGRKQSPARGMPGAISQRPYRPFPGPVARRLRAMMLDVVNRPGGTAYAAFHRDGSSLLPGLTVGGKTGTAEWDRQVVRDGRRTTREGTHAWFVGFAADERRAQPRTIAFAFLVEDVRGAGATGGQVCAPLARDLLGQVFGPSLHPEPEPAPSRPQAPRRWWEYLDPRRWF